MPKWGIALAVLLLCGYPLQTNAKSGIQDHAKRLQESRQNMLQMQQQQQLEATENKPMPIAKEAPKKVSQPAPVNQPKAEPKKVSQQPKVDKPKEKAEPKTEMKLIPGRVVRTQPHTGFIPPKIDEVKKDKPEPVKSPHDKAKEEHHKHSEFDKHHRPPHEPEHHRHTKKTEVRSYYVVSPVTRVANGNGALIYEANPHIYTPNSYSCYYRNDMKYCTDYKGKALTGRIVQNYEDSVAYEHYRNGRLHGETSVYSLDGKLWQVTHYSKGLKNGKETVYFENGRVNYTLNYNKGKIDGEVKQYDIYGTMLGEMRYSNGYCKYRYCRNDSSDEAMRARIKAKVFNDLLLCAY